MALNPSTGKPSNQPGPGKEPSKEKPKAPPPILVRTTPKATLLERLKEIKKKDLAFIASGLLVLIVAPLAQHYLMQPGERQLLEPGFSTREGFGRSPYEGGLNMLSDGSPVGGEVITPVAGRDPSSLLMPPGGPPAPAKPAAAQEGIRDALNKALQTSVPKAAEAAGLPQARGSLASALRGLAALAGATYGGGAGGPLLGQGVLQAAKQVPSRAAPRSYAGPLPLAGYRGAAGGIDGGSRDAIEALKAQAARAGDAFSRTGQGVTDLDASARESIKPDGAGISGGGPSFQTQSPNVGSQFPPANISLGEGLAYMAAKMRMEKAIELEFKKREMMEMLPYKIIEQGATKMFGAVADAMGKKVGEWFEDPADPDAGKYSCCQQKDANNNPVQSSCDTPTKGSPVGEKLYIKLPGGSEKDPGMQAEKHCPGGIVPAWVWKEWQKHPGGRPGGGGGGNIQEREQVSGTDRPVGPVYDPESHKAAIESRAEAAKKASDGLANTPVEKDKADALKSLVDQVIRESSATVEVVGVLAKEADTEYKDISLLVKGGAEGPGIDKVVEDARKLVNDVGPKIDEAAKKVEGIKPKKDGGTFTHLNAETYHKDAVKFLEGARVHLKAGVDGLGGMEKLQKELKAIDGRAKGAFEGVMEADKEVGKQDRSLQDLGAEAKLEIEKLKNDDSAAKANIEDLRRRIGRYANSLRDNSSSALKGAISLGTESDAFYKSYSEFSPMEAGVKGAVHLDAKVGMVGRHLTSIEEIVDKSNKAEEAGKEAKKK